MINGSPVYCDLLDSTIKCRRMRCYMTARHISDNSNAAPHYCRARPGLVASLVRSCLAHALNGHAACTDYDRKGSVSHWMKYH